MKITFLKSRFLEKLTPAMGTVSNKNTIASIEGVLIETVEDRLRLSTYDMKKGTVSEMECEEVTTPGSVIINAARLLHILKVMPEDTVVLEVDDRFNARISSGASSFSLFALKGTDFPNLPMLTGEKGFEIESGLLRRMIGKVIHSVGEPQESRPMLGGAFFRVEDGTFEIVSCDSFTLSVCKQSCDVRDIGAVDCPSFEFIVPGHALTELLRILPEEEEKTSASLEAQLFEELLNGFDLRQAAMTLTERGHKRNDVYKARTNVQRFLDDLIADYTFEEEEDDE